MSEPISGPGSNELATDLAAWCREKGGDISPADLQREFHFTWNWACSLLERLERDGELVRLPGSTLAWRLAAPAGKPSRGYALPLTPKEHGALLRLLDDRFSWETSQHDNREDLDLLRAVRAKLKRPA